MRAYVAKKFEHSTSKGGERMANVEEEVAEAVEAVDVAKRELTEAAEAIAEEAKKNDAKPTAKKGKGKGKLKGKVTTAKKPSELATKVLKVMATLKANGIVETNSTVLRDKCKTKTRGAIRQVMKGLEKDGKVVTIEEKHGTRRQFKYKLA
jgi:hypothetical protein